MFRQLAGALALVFVLTAMMSMSVAAAPAQPPTLNTLEPGGFHDIEQNLVINVVFVGYKSGTDINPVAFLSDLPSTYRVVNRYPSFYGENEYLGLTFKYDYNLVYADTSFEDQFFGYLSNIATPQPLTLYLATRQFERER